MKTHVVKAREIERRWVHIDADGQIVGRLATRVADILRGKDKPTFTPYMDVGDFVIITNCAKVKFTGRKLEQRTFSKYSGWQGGLKTKSLQEIFDTHPDEVVYQAVRGMLPHTKLGRAQIKKLRVFAGAEHPHIAQQPEVRTLG
jgi:large subunit ribosomal protein L13